MATIKSMPFPGESATVSLAMAAARMYAPKPEGEKPARLAPKRRAKAKKPARGGAKAKGSRGKAAR